MLVTVVLICGGQNSGYQLAQEFLTKAGLAHTKPSKREAYSPTDISSGVCSAYGLDKDDSPSIKQVEVGKVWQALSTDLMLANLTEPNWGWADKNLVYMLEHWRDFDPQIKFVLVYSSPEQTVAEMASEGELTAETVEQALFDWQKTNAELMRFYYKNKERCILLNSAFLSKDASHFISYSRDQLGADLSDVKNDAVAIPKRDPIYDLIAPMLIKDADDAYEVYQELESAADLPGNYIQSKSDDFGTHSKHNILGPYDKDREKLDPLELALNSWAQFNEMKKQCEQKEVELAHLKRERDEQKQETEVLEKSLKTKEKENKKLALELEKSAIERDEQKEESKFLTLQLHQVQEELEQTFLKLQKNEKSQVELQDKIGQLTKERGRLEKESDAFKGKLKALEVEIGQHKENAKKAQGLEAKLNEAAQESELQLLQLHQVQEELELYFQKYQEAIQTEEKQGTDSETSTDSARIEKIIDLRHFVDGDNWYYAEHDGRWAGPNLQSALRIDKIAAGNYRLEIDVVDAMSPDVLRGMKVALNGKSLSLNWQGALASRWAPLAKLLRRNNPNYPLLLTGRVLVTPADIKDGLALSFDFPDTISPAAEGADDLRSLAVRIRTVRFIKK